MIRLIMNMTMIASCIMAQLRFPGLYNFHTINKLFELSLCYLTSIVLGGGGGYLHQATQNLEKKKCPCLQNDNTALIKQISLLDTALVMTNE